MSSTRFILKKKEFAYPPNVDPRDTDQWIPRVSWNGQALRGMGAASDHGDCVCVQCGNAGVRGVKPSRKQKRIMRSMGTPYISKMFEPNPDTGSSFVGYDKFPAPDGLCSYCHSKVVGSANKKERNEQRLIQLTAAQKGGRLDTLKGSLTDKGWKTSIVQKKKKPGDKGKVFLPAKSDGPVIEIKKKRR